VEKRAELMLKPHLHKGGAFKDKAGGPQASPPSQRKINNLLKQLNS